MIRLLAIAMTAVIGLSLLAMGATVFGPREEAAPAFMVGATAAPAPADERTGYGALVVERDRSGQFRVDATVNGEDARFLVDTGADVVAVGPEEAERLGIAFDPANFAPIMKTASGTGRGVIVTADRLEVAGRELRDVPVAVVEGLDIDLLGQSALSRLGRVTLKGDRLMIGG